MKHLRSILPYLAGMVLGRLAPLLAIFLIAFLLQATGLVHAADEPKVPEWVNVAHGTAGLYDIQPSSIVPHPESRSINFNVRMTPAKPIKKDAGTVTTIIEHVVVLCDADVYITGSQFQYDEKQELVDAVFTPTVYPNPHDAGRIVTGMIAMACGRPIQQPHQHPLTGRKLEII